MRNGASAALVARSHAADLDVRASFPLVEVDDPLAALQRLARHHRQNHIKEVLAVTGSNGKTTVKNALEQIFGDQEVIVSPGSYNSKLGVPLSILSGSKPVDLAVLEIGVSAPGEMQLRRQIAAPDFGILTNIGLAHFAAFGSQQAIAEEKISLFQDIGASGWVLLPEDDPFATAAAANLKCRKIALNSDQDPVIFKVESDTRAFTVVQLKDRRTGHEVELRVKARSIEILTDLHFAISAARLLNFELDRIAAALNEYEPSPTRAEIWATSGGFRVISDIDVSDPASVHSALDLASTRTPEALNKVFVFSGMLELGEKSESEHAKIGVRAAQCGFNQLLLYNDPELDLPRSLQATQDAYGAACPEGEVAIVETANEIAQRLSKTLSYGDTVLFKGPRYSHIGALAEEVAGTLAQRTAWIDVGAIADNMARFERHCGGVKLMAVLKASAYGSEIEQLGHWLGLLGVEAIGVSSTSEGVAVRKAGFTKEIFVLLPDQDDVANILRFRLTPVLHSKVLVEAVIKHCDATGQTCNVHLEVDTGMHRLGIQPEEVLQVAQRIGKSETVALAGLGTHFSSADDPQEDAHTLAQIAIFDAVIEQLKANGFVDLEVHAANTPAAIRFPKAHYSMIRVGLGLYGIYPSNAVKDAMKLRLAIGVTSLIADIRECPAGEALGYNRTFIADRDLRVAVVPFGYNDGLPLQLSGKGNVLVAGKPARILGRISMDQMIIDITDIEGAVLGSDVLIYGAYGGHEIRPEDVARQAGTISHELLTRLGRRVIRIYREP